MAKVKKGEFFSCTECGLVVVVDEACGCASAKIVCCEQPMAKGKAKKKAAALPAPPKSGSAKTGKAGGAAKAAIAKPKAKGTVKKAPPKKAPAAKK